MKPITLTPFILSAALLCACTGTPASSSNPSAENTASSPAASTGADAGQTSGVLFGTVVASTVQYDANHIVNAIGFDLPLAAVEKAPTSLPPGADPARHDPADSVRLSLPADVAKATFIDHIDIDYNPLGHPPAEIYGVPHFDFHFYGITPSEQQAIDCTDTTDVSPDHLPPRYVADKAGLPPDGGCVPYMGIHAEDVTSPEFDKVHAHRFDKTMILGYYGNKSIFIEPMVSRDQLLKKETITLPIEIPPAMGKAVLFPTQFAATYDSAENAYHVTLSAFKAAQ